jgi:hypothetical protein
VTRLVLLGASNVRRGLPTVVQTARAASGPGLEILGAFGHGRSYGGRSRVLIRELPGILDCGIWGALAPGGGETKALITDVGNDVLYGHSAPAILAWVSECVSRLRLAGAAIRVTTLPLDRIRRVSPAEFLLFRTLFFPGSTVGWREAIETSGQLDAGLRDLAATARATLVEAPGGWYGTDPIHIRRRCRRAAWAEILGASHAAPPMSMGEAMRLRAAAPEVRWIAGREGRRRQPAFAAPDGLRVALY